ncbi:hypothetical protein B0H13DRAFT_2393065 [Mycena leptocephala]|nr:hypothetical protein B0H13DRAFT_2393065 [Mycena leptocephala]
MICAGLEHAFNQYITGVKVLNGKFSKGRVGEYVVAFTKLACQLEDWRWTKIMKCCISLMQADNRHLISASAAMNVDRGAMILGSSPVKGSDDDEISGNPELAHAEAYQKFIVYPRGKHAPVKTSLDKRLEDDLLGKSDAVPASGANKKLVAAGIKTDPPPQYKPLGGGIKGSKQDEPDLSEDDRSSPPTTSSVSGFDDVPKPSEEELVLFNPEEPDDNDTRTRNGDDQDTEDLPIIIKFNGDDPREVWLAPAQRSQISVTKTEDNTGTSYLTSLKHLLPIAIGELSPIKKDAKGKIGISGPATGGRVNLGTVDQFTLGPLPPILDLHINDYSLNRVPHGLLCDIFYEAARAPTG